MLRVLTLVILHGIILWPDATSAKLVLNFDGKEYLEHDRTANTCVTSSRFKNRVKIQFKTIHPSGILLFAGGSQGDYIAVLLLHGKLRLVINRKLQQDSQADILQVTIGNNLCDGEWHVLKMTRNGKKLNTNLDNKREHHIIPGHSKMLHLDLSTYVAGIDKTRLFHKHTDAYKVPYFKGCLQSASLDCVNRLEGAYVREKQSPDFKIIGTSSQGCRNANVNGLLGFPSIGSFLIISSPVQKSLVDVKFLFRTNIKEGMLLYSRSSYTSVRIVLVDGIARLEIYNVRYRKLPFSIGKNLADGNWHSIRAVVNNNGFNLDLDRESIHWKAPRSIQANLSFKSIRFGGFVGCLNDLRVYSIPIDADSIKKIRHNGLQINKCSIENVCFPNPCKRSGQCINHDTYFTCDCSMIHYTGPLCTQPTYRSTCDEYASLGLSEESVCSLAPRQNSSIPFDVMCHPSDPRGPALVMTNSKTGWQKVSEDSDYAGAFYYVHVMKGYSVSYSNIKAVIARSTRCQQYLAVKSRSTLNGFFWVSINVTQMQIPLTRNGYLRDKSLLPVVALLFSPSVVGSSYMLGPLECFGTKVPSNNLPGSLSVHRLLKSVCKPLVPVVQPSPSLEVYTNVTSTTKNPTVLLVTSTEWPRRHGSSSRSLTVPTRLPHTIDNTIPSGKNTSQLDLQSRYNHDNIDKTGYKNMTWVSSVFLALVPMVLMMGLLYTLHRKVNWFYREKKKPKLTQLFKHNNCKNIRSSSEVETLPESSLWMKLNAGGYDVKTGKITYGLDLQCQV